MEIGGPFELKTLWNWAGFLSGKKLLALFLPVPRSPSGTWNGEFQDFLFSYPPPPKIKQNNPKTQFCVDLSFFYMLPTNKPMNNLGHLPFQTIASTLFYYVMLMASYIWVFRVFGRIKATKSDTTQPYNLAIEGLCFISLRGSFKILWSANKKEN